MDEWTFVIASGPSLQREDAEAVRGKGLTIAVNCGVFFAPWADILYAGDAVWWRYYGPKVGWFKGRRVSRNYKGKNIETVRGKGWKRTGGNSGHMALQLAVDLGAKNVALLGFDQQKTDGKAHCHADHPKRYNDGKTTNMGNANGVAAWPRLMARTADDLNEMDIKVINLSRETALTCFPRLTVKQFLKLVKEN